MTFIDHFTCMYMHHRHLHNSWLQQNMHQVHASLDVNIPGTIKRKNNKGIIDSNMKIKLNKKHWKESVLHTIG